MLTCFFVAFLCILAGCLPRGDRVATGEQGKTGIAEKKVDLQSKSGENSFPDFLVGRWKAADQSQYKWGFKFEKDGTISVMRNFLDMYIIVSEGGIYEPTTDPNKDSACTLGPVDVNYDPNGRILTVKVVTDYFMLRANGEVLEGSSIDKIFGPVSKDGLTWNAEWQSVSRMLDGPPLDFNNPSIYPVVFYKVREESK
jgi:hypothetical protein